MDENKVIDIMGEALEDADIRQDIKDGMEGSDFLTYSNYYYDKVQNYSFMTEDKLKNLIIQDIKNFETLLITRELNIKNFILNDPEFHVSETEALDIAKEQNIKDIATLLESYFNGNLQEIANPEAGKSPLLDDLYSAQKNLSNKLPKFRKVYSKAFNLEVRVPINRENKLYSNPKKKKYKYIDLSTKF